MEKQGFGVVVVGGQWGDEGKGRIVDMMSESFDVVVRFHGGNNAGHSLHFEGKSLVLHMIPCGIVRPEKISIIGNGVVLNPGALFDEMNELENLGVKCSPSNLKISKNAHVLLPWHLFKDEERESDKASFLGTTKRGIGPCYEDKIARSGLRLSDLLDPSVLKIRLEKLSLRYPKISGDQISKITESYQEYGAKLRPFVCDTGEILQKLLQDGAKVLFEGAQGALLDIDHGTYPYVTSSNCVSAQAAIGSGIGPKWLKEVYLVSKAYCTRVGEGPFFTELPNAEQEKLRKLGGEFGATTGRPRRCGWLDLVALKYAARINGATGLVITKFDVLAGLGEIKIATDYIHQGKSISFVDAMDLQERGSEFEVKYENFLPIGLVGPKVSVFKDLPKTFRAICRRIEEYVGVPVKMVSFGRERGQEILL